jgi:hypothetical protein
MPPVAAYLTLKAVTYAAWCLLALRITRGRESGDLGRAAGYGVARLVLGLALGAVLVFALPSIAPAANRTSFSMPVYALALGLVRVFEWLAVGGFIVASSPRSPTAVASIAWIAGGVAVSVLTDLIGVGIGVRIGALPC